MSESTKPRGRHRLLDVDQALALRQRYRNSEVTLPELMVEFNTSVTTLHNLLGCKGAYAHDTGAVTIRPGARSKRTTLSPEQVTALRAQCRRAAQSLEHFAVQYGVDRLTITNALLGKGSYNYGDPLSHREYKESRRNFNAEQAAALRQRFRAGGVSVYALAQEHHLKVEAIHQVLSCKNSYAGDNDPVEAIHFRLAPRKARVMTPKEAQP